MAGLRIRGTRAPPLTRGASLALSLSQVSEALVNMAMKRYTTDNTSVVVIDLKGQDYWHAMASKPRGPGAFLSGLFGR